MATYLVTGGCGFIGSHLADALIAAGHSVRILDDLSTGKLANKPQKADFIRGDVTDERKVAKAMSQIDGCFHLAAIASVERSNLDWIGTHRTNLTGAITVFDAARRAKAAGSVPVVYASSAAVYGDNANIPLAETEAGKPLSAYGADKLGCEQHAFVAGKVHGLPTCGLRFFNAYGPRQDPASPYSGVISIFCNRLKAGQGVTIFGDGQQTRDFIFVGDVVRALLAAMERVSAEGNVYNVCTGRRTSVLDLVHTIAGILGTTVSPNFSPARAGDIRASLGDPLRACQELKFEAQTDLRTGLAITLTSLLDAAGSSDPGCFSNQVRDSGDLGFAPDSGQS
jgi:UDP-glucose 4-epimerase